MINLAFINLTIQELTKIFNSNGSGAGELEPGIVVNFLF